MSVDSKIRNVLATKPRVGEKFWPVLGDRIGDLHGQVWHTVAAVVKGYGDGSWLIRTFDGRTWVTAWSNKHRAWVFAP